MVEHRQPAFVIVTTVRGLSILGDTVLYGHGEKVVVLFNYHSLQLIQIDASVLLEIHCTIGVLTGAGATGLIIYHQWKN